EDLTVRTGESGANCHRHPVANGATHVLQPVVWRCTSGQRVEATARSYRLIDDDSLFRDHIPEDRGNLVRIERACWQRWRERLLHRGILRLGTHHVCEALKCINDVVLQGGKRRYSTPFWR